MQIPFLSARLVADWELQNLASISISWSLRSLLIPTNIAFRIDTVEVWGSSPGEVTIVFDYLAKILESFACEFFPCKCRVPRASKGMKSGMR